MMHLQYTLALPWRGNMSVLDDGVVQVPVEALLDIRHILHLSKKLTIRNLKMGGKRNTKCEAKEIQSVRLQKYKILGKTRSSWVNCALRDEEAVYWVSVAHYEAVAVSN